MFFSSIRIPTIQLLIPVVLILMADLANADHGVDQVVQQRTSVQSAKISLIQAQLELERWKHSQLEELHRDGFASWLELRRHQFKVDTIFVRLKSAREFEDLLSKASEQRTSFATDQPVYRDRQSRPIKVFAPDSLRLVGWIEGQSPAEPEAFASNESAIKAAQEKLAAAQKRSEASRSSDSASANFCKKASLELNLAQRELEYLRSTSNLQPTSHLQTHSSVVVDLSNLVDSKPFVTANQSDELKLATLTVKQAEAAAVGHIKSAEIMLIREQRRADAVRRLHSQGHASPKELEIVDARVSDVKSQLNAFLRKQATLRESLGTTFEKISDPQKLAIPTGYDSAAHWSTVVLNDQEFILHLLDLRGELFDEITNSETARLKTAFLQDVLDRLKLASTKSIPASQIDSVLNEGQLHEIESYELDIEFTKANQMATLERQQILVHEENRFLQQTIAIHDAASGELASSNSHSLDALGLFGHIHPTTVLTSSGNPKPLARFSYLEFEDLRDVGRSKEFSSARSNLRFVDSTYSFQSLQLFNLTPVRSSLLISDARRSYSRPGELNIQPHWMKYLDRNLRQNSYTVLRLSGPPYADSWPQKAFYGQYGYRAFGGTYGYPNGILRADWRSNLTPGIVPWYAPGSPANIRANQLHYRRDGKPYKRW